MLFEVEGVTPTHHNDKDRTPQDTMSSTEPETPVAAEPEQPVATEPAKASEKKSAKPAKSKKPPRTSMEGMIWNGKRDRRGILFASKTTFDLHLSPLSQPTRSSIKL